MRAACSLLLLVITGLSLFVLSGCGAAVSAPADDSRRRYHDGQRWVELVVMLDRLQVERASEGGANRVEVYLLRRPVSSVAELDAVARQMAGAQADIRVVSAYVRPADSPSAQPARLTRRFSLNAAGGHDPAAIAARVQARVVETVDGQVGTVICQAGDSLTAALDAAANLGQTPGVVFAAPLIERAAVRR